MAAMVIRVGSRLLILAIAAFVIILLSDAAGKKIRFKFERPICPLILTLSICNQCSEIISGISYYVALSAAKPPPLEHRIDVANMTVLSWKPRLVRYAGLLTAAECDYIVLLGRSKVQQSLTVGPNGTSVVNPHRSSYGYFLNRESQHDSVIMNIEKRLFEWTQIPKENGEAMNLLWYRVGQEYKPHFDYFSGDEWLRHGGNRIATVLMYLSDVEDGGETIFPNAEGGQIKVKPKKGDAVLFYSLTTENKPDSFSLHGSVPVIKGDKWAMTKWFREKRWA